MKYYKKIVGERLYLSPINADEVTRRPLLSKKTKVTAEHHLNNYLKWMNDETVSTNFGQYPRLISSKSDLKWLYEPPADMHRYAMVLTCDDKLIGSISLHNIDHLNRNAFIGIFIGEEENRSNGYGAEAIRLILGYGFKTMNLHSIMLTVHADNTAGIACYNKVGFKEAGRLRQCIFKGGKYIDKIYMDILENEFARCPLLSKKTKVTAEHLIEGCV